MNFQVHNRTMKNEKWWEKKKNENGNKEQDSRVKTRKGGLEQKWENFQKLAGKKKKKRMKGQRPNNI